MMSKSLRFRRALVLAPALILIVVPAVPAAGAAPEASAPKSPSDQLSTKFVINGDNPEASVPTDKAKNDNPIEFGYFIQDLLARAEAARKAKNYSALIAYDRAVAKAVPDHAASWSELCGAYSLINDRDHAARACKIALERPGTVLNDFVRFVTLTVQKDGQLTSEESADVRGVLDHLETANKEGPEAALSVQRLRCQVGVKTNDVPLLQACTAALVKAAPDDTRTVIYQWTLAVRQGHGAQAARLLDRAKQLGLPEANIESMARFTPEASRGWKIWSGIIVILTALGVGLWMFRATRRRRTLAMPA